MLYLVIAKLSVLICNSGLAVSEGYQMFLENDRLCLTTCWNE